MAERDSRLATTSLWPLSARLTLGAHLSLGIGAGRAPWTRSTRRLWLGERRLDVAEHILKMLNAVVDIQPRPESDFNNQESEDDGILTLDFAMQSSTQKRQSRRRAGGSEASRGLSLSVSIFLRVDGFAQCDILISSARRGEERREEKSKQWI